MAFGDWDFFFGSNTGGIPVGETTILFLTPPIEGTGSLLSKQSVGTVFAQTMNTLPKTISPLTHGFDAGRFQTLLRFDDISGTSPDVCAAGFVFMQSERDLSYTGSLLENYAWCVEVSEGFTGHALVLYKLMSGLNVESNALPVSEEIFRYTNPFGTLTGSTVVALEVEWRAEPSVISALGGAQIRGRAGLTDFSSLLEYATILDTSSPLSTTVGEGLFTTFKSSVSLITKSVTFDSTSLYRILT
jgi:hypothetical protein